jgi:hypothetical protein
MQSGFVPQSHLGTSLDPTVSKKYEAGAMAAKNTFAGRVYDSTFPGVESMSERDSVFPKFKPVLQGMNLEHVPTGGFSSPISFVVGAEDYNYRSANPTFFMQPGNAIKRTEINTEIPVTGGSLNSELVYKNADTKQRNPHGFMTVKRAEQEAAASTARRNAALAYELQGGAPVPPVVPLPKTTMPEPVVSPSVQRVVAATNQNVYMPAPIPVVFPPSPKQQLAGAGVNAMSSPPSFQQFLTATKNMWNGNSSPGSYWSNNWPYIVNVILLSLLLVLLIVTIVLAAMPRHKPRHRKPKLQRTYIMQQTPQIGFDDPFTTFGQFM